MWAGGPINGTFFRWANKWYTYPKSVEMTLPRKKSDSHFTFGLSKSSSTSPIKYLGTIRTFFSGD
jgi:hypothetical protein